MRGSVVDVMMLMMIMMERRRRARALWRKVIMRGWRELKRTRKVQFYKERARGVRTGLKNLT